MPCKIGGGSLCLPLKAPIQPQACGIAPGKWIEMSVSAKGATHGVHEARFQR